MASVTSAQPARALLLLSDAAAERRADLQEFASDSDVIDTDDEVESESPIYDQFYENGGASAIIQMTNFSPTEFYATWCVLEKAIKERYNAGRGRKCSHTSRDVLFMTLAVLKRGGQWDILAQMFSLKCPTFDRMIMKFIDIISYPVFENYVECQSKKLKMELISSKKIGFKNYHIARYATDVTFQQSFRASGSLEEGKLYLSGNHKLYGYKTEVSVLPNGLALGCIAHEPGSVSDLKIFEAMLPFHAKQLRKREGETDMDDDGPLSDEFPNYWAVLCDKGYYGAKEFCPVIHPTKKHINGTLTQAEVSNNRHISSDIIIVENCFGRLCGLWNFMAAKWKWSEAGYDSIFRLCVGLTNYHLHKHPVRAEDSRVLKTIKNRRYHIATTQIQKRRQVQRRYREKRRRRVEMQFRSIHNTDESD